MGQLQRQDASDAALFGFVRPPDLAVECEAFQGTLGMLFQCVREHKVDLLGVPLAPICQAYFEHIATSETSTVDEASAGALALAYLIERKAWLLLPAPEEEPTEDEVLDMIEPYVHEFVPVIEALRQKHGERGQLFFRHPGGNDGFYELPLELGDASASDLADVLRQLLEKAEPDPTEALARPRRSLAEQMVLVMKALTDEPRSILQLVEPPYTRSEAVWWFLALLELIRLGQARVVIDEQGIFFASGRRD